MRIMPYERTKITRKEKKTCKWKGTCDIVNLIIFELCGGMMGSEDENNNCSFSLQTSFVELKLCSDHAIMGWSNAKCLH